jgi:hypothetical protein
MIYKITSSLINLAGALNVKHPTIIKFDNIWYLAEEKTSKVVDVFHADTEYELLELIKAKINLVIWDDDYEDFNPEKTSMTINKIIEKHENKKIIITKEVCND